MGAETHGSSIVNDSEVCLSLAWFRWFRLDKVGRFSQVVCLQLFFKGLVRGLGEHTLFLQDGHNTHRLQVPSQKKYALNSVLTVYTDSSLLCNFNQQMQAD